MASFDAAFAPDLSPVSLSYAAALRGIKPRKPGKNFSYAFIDVSNPLLLTCIAASNPDGEFWGITENPDLATFAEKQARERYTENVKFVSAFSVEALANFNFPPLDYLVWDSITNKETNPEKRDAIISLAEKALEPGGLLILRYRVCESENETLSFLAQEFCPQINKENEKEFLEEIKTLGALYFQNNNPEKEKIKKSIEDSNLKEFFSICKTNAKAVSETFEIMSRLLPLNFAFVGDADIRSNYMDFVVPSSAHKVLEECRDHLLYEPIKDFAMNRLVRNDIWCKLPVEQTENMAELFGNFTYGILSSRERIPSKVETMGNSIDLTQPVMTKVINLMADLPMAIGDFLNHPLGRGHTPSEVVFAIHTLVAAGIARPMRGHFSSNSGIHISQLKWAAGYNRYLNKEVINEPHVLLASPVVGSAVKVPARDALVMQAVNRVGLANSAGALLLELERLKQEPSIAATIMDVAEPTEEMAENITRDVISRSILQWYAYGLLEAA